MTIKFLLMSSAAIAVGATLLSAAAVAQTQLPEPPQASQQRSNRPNGQPSPGGNKQAQGHTQQRPHRETRPMVPIADVVLSFSATATQPAQPVAVAPDIDMVPITLYMTSTNGGGGEFMLAMSGICSGSAFLRNDVQTIDATGFCNYTDIDGDQVFEHFVIPPQPRDNPLKAAGHWTGGTGKYRNLEGGFVLTGIVLPPVADGIIQITGQKQGRYTIGETGQTEAPAKGQTPSAANKSSSEPGQAAR